MQTQANIAAVIARITLAMLLVLAFSRRTWADDATQAAVDKAQAAVDKAQKDYDDAAAAANPKDTNLDADVTAAKENADDKLSDYNQALADVAKAQKDVNNNVPGSQQTLNDANAAAAKALNALKDAVGKYNKAVSQLQKSARATALRRLRGVLLDKQNALNKARDKNGDNPVPTTPRSATGIEPIKTLSSLIKDGKVQAVATPTGQTIGNVANVALTNKTDEWIELTIPATVLVSVDGTTQNFGVPQPTTVELKPDETKTVPLDGICTQAHKPPGGADKPGGLMIADPEDPTFDVHYKPQLDCTQNVVQAAKELEDSGQFHTPFHDDPTKEVQTIEQQTIWAANPSHDGRNTTKEDLALKVYEQTGATTDEQKKALQPGIDSIWTAVQLTGARAKVFEVGDNGGSPGASSGEVQDNPHTAEQPPTKKKFELPTGAVENPDWKAAPPDAQGNTTRKYTLNGADHTVTIDKDGGWTDEYTKPADKDHPDVPVAGATTSDGYTTSEWTKQNQYDESGNVKGYVKKDYKDGKLVSGYKETKTTNEDNNVTETTRERLAVTDKGLRTTDKSVDKVDDKYPPTYQQHSEEVVDPATDKTISGSRETTIWKDGHVDEHIIDHYEKGTGWVEDEHYHWDPTHPTPPAAHFEKTPQDTNKTPPAQPQKP
ncbi:MAG: hypothetical protein ABSC42_14660 [Tepidisphaeraceae bacterium]|jgi:hypothetical protein